MADPTREFTLAGRTALVTGGARRLGRAIAVALAAQGAHVVVHYRSSATEAEMLCAEVRERGVQAWGLQADLADPAQAEALLQRAVDTAGPIGLLINNASTFAPSRLATVSFDELSANTAVNAWAPFVLSRAFARQGVRGRIINLLDAHIESGDPVHVAYLLSKHLLTTLTRLTALEYAPDITVNAVAPGLVLAPEGKDFAQLPHLIATVPLGRHGAPRDIVRTVLFLLESDFITGQVVYVDGGAHLVGAG